MNSEHTQPLRICIWWQVQDSLLLLFQSTLQLQITSATTGISHLTYHYYRYKNPFKTSYPICWHQEEVSGYLWCYYIWRGGRREDILILSSSPSDVSVTYFPWESGETHLDTAGGIWDLCSLLSTLCWRQWSWTGLRRSRGHLFNNEVQLAFLFNRKSLVSCSSRSNIFTFFFPQ